MIPVPYWRFFAETFVFLGGRDRGGSNKRGMLNNSDDHNCYTYLILGIMIIHHDYSVIYIYYIGSPSGPSKVPELYRYIYIEVYIDHKCIAAWTVADPSAPLWVLHAGGKSQYQFSMTHKIRNFPNLWHAGILQSSTIHHLLSRIIAIGCHWYRDEDVTWCNFHQWFACRLGTKRPCWALLACCRNAEKVGLRCRGRRWEIPTHRTKMEDF